MAAKNKFYKTFYTKAEFDRFIADFVSDYIAAYMDPFRKISYDDGWRTGNTFAIDIAVIAIGRMREKGEEFDIAKLMQGITEAASDYGDLFDQDADENHDDELWWSGAKLDQELFSYIPEGSYPKFNERYAKQEVTSEQLRAMT